MDSISVSLSLFSARQELLTIEGMYKGWPFKQFELIGFC